MNKDELREGLDNGIKSRIRENQSNKQGKYELIEVGDNE